jgi:long-chain acyl-CoA synthetase
MIKALAIFLIGVATTTGGAAATLAGVTLPDTYTVGGQSLALNGIGLRTLTIFEVKVYVAGLYLAQPSHDAQQIIASPGPKVVLIQFLHSGSKADVEKEYREGESNNCGAGGCPAADQADFERLVSVAPGVKPGDTSTFIFTQQGFQLLANNRVIGDFANPDLANRLLAGFIGAHPPSQDLRAHLLGLASE